MSVLIVLNMVALVVTTYISLIYISYMITLNKSLCSKQIDLTMFIEFWRYYKSVFIKKKEL